MTVKELSQFYYLSGEIEDCRRKLAELEARRGVGSVVVDDMPHGKGPAASVVEQLAADIVDLRAIIHAKQIESIHEKARLERYIAGIPDALTRRIFELRFVDCLTWGDVARRIGARNTPDGVRMICHRYIKKSAEI